MHCCACLMRMSSERFAHCYAGTVQAETSVTTQLRENLTVAVVESGRSRAPIPVQQAFLNSARNKPIAGGTQTVRSASAVEHSACMPDMHDVPRMTTCFRTHACVPRVDSVEPLHAMLMMMRCRLQSGFGGYPWEQRIDGSPNRGNGSALPVSAEAITESDGTTPNCEVTVNVAPATNGTNISNSTILALAYTNW